MRDTFLMDTLLRTLNRVECGIKNATLKAEVEVALDRPDITTYEFHDALTVLEERGLVVRSRNLLGEIIWEITPLGRAALKGA